VVEREGRHTGRLEERADSQLFYRIKSDAQRVADRLGAQNRGAGGDDGGGAVGARVVENEILEAVDARVAVMRDVAGEVMYAVPSPIRAVPAADALLFRNVVVDFGIDLIGGRRRRALREPVVHASERVAGLIGGREVLIESLRDLALAGKR